MHLTMQNDLHFLEVEPTILLLRGSLSISWATDIIDGSVQGLRFTFDNGGDEQSMTPPHPPPSPSAHYC